MCGREPGGPAEAGAAEAGAGEGGAGRGRCGGGRCREGKLAGWSGPYRRLTGHNSPFLRRARTVIAGELAPGLRRKGSPRQQPAGIPDWKEIRAAARRPSESRPERQTYFITRTKRRRPEEIAPIVRRAKMERLGMRPHARGNAGPEGLSRRAVVGVAAASAPGGEGGRGRPASGACSAGRNEIDQPRASYAR